MLPKQIRNVKRKNLIGLHKHDRLFLVSNLPSLSIKSSYRLYARMKFEINPSEFGNICLAFQVTCLHIMFFRVLQLEE